MVFLSPTLGMRNFPRSFALWLVAAFLISGTRASAQTIIDVLIAYTPAVEAYYGDRDGVVSHVYGSWYSADEVLDRSDVDGARFKVIHAEKVDYIEDPNDMGTDLDRLRSRDGIMDEILDRRDELGADLVCLFRLGSAGETSGIAFTLTNQAGSPEYGFSVADARSAMSAYTFAHELGHNMGAAHDRENAEVPGLFNYSHGYRMTSEEWGQVRTVMAYEPGRLVPMFSNPRINAYGGIIGVPEGAPNAADNAKTLAFSAPIVAAYRDHVERAPWITPAPDRTTIDHNGDGQESVEMWGIVDFPYSDIAAWEWSWEGGSVRGEGDERWGTGVLPIGENVVTVKATDIDGRVGTTTMLVTILEHQHITHVDGRSGLSAFVRENGLVNTFGSLDARGEIDNYPHKLFSLEGVVSVSLGYEHALFLKSDRTLWVTGSDKEGQLGLNSESPKPWEYPVHKDPVEALVSDAVSVAAGGRHTLIIKSDGSLWGVGDNSYGQLGLGTDDEIRAFTKIVPKNVIQVSADGDNTLFVLSDGSLWGMGRNDEGQLGIGSKGQQLYPEMIVSEGVRSVSLSFSHAAFVKEDGSMWTMGRNEFGQLGDGTNTDRLAPVKVIASEVSAVEAGGFSTFAIMEDGSAWGMGSNANGQLGDGSKQNRNLPTRIHFGNVAAISAGDAWTHFLRSDGALWGAGANYYGQLAVGEADFLDRPLSIEVVASQNELENAAPLADSSSRLNVYDEKNDGIESIVLDGSASSDDWQIVSWNWAWEGGSASGRRATVELPSGNTEVTLLVKDNEGEESSRSFTVEVLSESAFKEWLGQYFTAAEIDGFGNAFDSIDADDDGLSNLWEWRLRLNPANPQSGLRVASTIEEDGVEIHIHPMYHYFNYDLMESSDLANWADTEQALLPFRETGVFKAHGIEKFYRVRISK